MSESEIDRCARYLRRCDLSEVCIALSLVDPAQRLTLIHSLEWTQDEFIAAMEDSIKDSIKEVTERGKWPT